MLVSFGVLGFFGKEIYRKAPPVPSKVVTESGEVIMTGAEIKDGQNVWQSIGGQELGTVWGHGAYKAPDWTADWLHREAMYMLDSWAKEDYSQDYDQLTNEQQAGLQERLQERVRENTYDPASGVLRISALRADAYRVVSRHYSGLFRDDACTGGPPGGLQHSAEHDQGCGSHEPDERLSLVGDLGNIYRPSGKKDHLHQQLACREAHREYPSQFADPVDRLFGDHPAGGNRPAGLVLCLQQG